MKTRITIARCMSRVIFAVLYLTDLYFIFRVTNDIYAACIGVGAILVLIAAQTGFNLISLKAHSLSSATRTDANYVQRCMDEVVRRSVSIGRKRKNARLWIADNEALKCYTVGNNIVVNKNMLRLGDSSMLEGCLACEYSHILNGDYWLKALVNINVLSLLCFIGLMSFGAAIGIVLLAVIVFGMIFSSWTGFIMGSVFGKVLKKFFGLLLRSYYYICKGFAAFIYKRQAFEADRYSGLLGYSNGMRSYLRLMERMDQRAVQTSWTEDLLNDKPSNYRRISQFDRIEEEISRQEAERENHRITHHNNPFY